VASEARHADGSSPAPAGYGLFGRGPEYTVGVEEELMLVDADTMALAPDAAAVLRATDDPDNIKPEIRQCMLEISSQPCRTTRELLTDLGSLRERVRRAAAAQGCRVAGGGTHAFSQPEEQPVTDSARYRRIMVDNGFTARWSLVFGTHVHVAVGSADKALQVTEALLGELPTLVALASSSPVWSGVDTGMASTRLALWAAAPRSGLPPAFPSFADYRASLEVLHRTGAVPDCSHVWWDVRSQERLGTIEVRVLDGQPSLRDTVALAGLVQSLVRYHGRRWEDGVRVVPHRFLVGENRWMAVLHGMAARFAHSDGTVVTARAAVDELLDRVARDAGVLDTTWALAHLTDLADRGGPATRERELLARTGDPTALMRELVELTETGGGGTDVRADDGAPGPDEV
jgi:carboxylate-amine ligase